MKYFKLIVKVGENSKIQSSRNCLTFGINHFFGRMFITINYLINTFRFDIFETENQRLDVELTLQDRFFGESGKFFIE